MGGFANMNRKLRQITQVKCMSAPQDPRAFRNALGQFATGVTVVTTTDTDGRKVGMTANSFSSVSLEPMLVLWSVAKTSNSFDVFNETEHFNIHILNSEQKDLSNHFASKDIADRFADIEHSTGHGGSPLLTDYSAVFQCDIEARYEGGDHIILVGRVVEFDNKEKAPLLFHCGQYAELPESA